MSSIDVRHVSKSFGRSANGTVVHAVDAVSFTVEELDASVGTQPPFGGLPILVLAAATPSPGQDADQRLAWIALQEDLVTVSEAPRLQVVPHSDHLSLLHHPDHAGEVARAIASLLPDASSSPTHATKRRP